MALDLRAEHDYEEAREFLFTSAADETGAADGSDETARIRDRLQRANSLRPGTAGILLEAFLERRAGRVATAEALVRKATRREPENVVVWQALLTISPDADERERARREVRRLDPARAQS